MMNVTLWLRLALVATVCLSGCSQPRDSDVGRASGASVTEVGVRVQVWDETASRPPGDRAEIWLRGTGSWFLDLKDGGDVNVLGKRPVDVEHELFIYPDGRDGSEINVPFRLAEAMCPDGCPRDSVLVSIYDDRVEVVGTPLVGGTSHTFKR